MSDYVHVDRRTRLRVETGSLESRAMFALFYALFLCRAIAVRLMPWHRSWRQPSRGLGRESIFREASTAAGVCVTSSFMGL